MRSHKACRSGRLVNTVRSALNLRIVGRIKFPRRVTPLFNILRARYGAIRNRPKVLR